MFSCPETEEFANEMTKNNPNLRLGKINWGTFADGFPNLFIENVLEVRHAKHTIFLASMHAPDSIFKQLSLIYSLPRYLAKNFSVVLPYFPTGTMERIDIEGQVATAATLIRLLGIIPMTKNGPTKIIIFDIHALQERFYFPDSVIPICLSAAPLFLNEIELLNEDKITIAFPDEGATKRFGKLYQKYPIVTCIKVRQQHTRKVEVKDGNPKECHVFIIDDLVQTGGTLLECAKALKESGACKISVCCTHAVFPNDSWKKFINPEVSCISKFYVTNSIPSTTDKLKDVEVFKVLSLEPLIQDYFKY